MIEGNENVCETIYINNNTSFKSNLYSNPSIFQEETIIDTTTTEDSFRNERSKISLYLKQEQPLQSTESILNRQKDSIKKYFEKIENKKNKLKEHNSKLTEIVKQNLPFNNLKAQEIISKYLYLNAKNNINFDRKTLSLSNIEEKEKQLCRICEKSTIDIFFGCQKCRNQNYFLCKSCFKLICTKKLHNPTHYFKIFKQSTTNKNNINKNEDNKDYSWELLDEIKEIVVEKDQGKTEEIITAHIHLQNIGKKSFFGFDFDVKNSDFVGPTPENKEIKPGEIYEKTLGLAKLSYANQELGHFKIILSVKDKNKNMRGKPLIIKVNVISKDLVIY